jgi:hypothetical protein
MIIVIVVNYHYEINGERSVAEGGTRLLGVGVGPK